MPGIPGTGEGIGTINEPPSPTTCPAGYALNNQNQCVLIPIGTGLGDITQVEVPNTSTAGSSIIIKTWFKNKGTSTLDYKVRIVITGLNIDITSPSLTLIPNQTAMIETTIMIPGTAVNATYSGVVQLNASNQTTNALVLQDTENFSLVVGSGTTSGATITLSAASVQRGKTFSINAAGFNPGEKILFQVFAGTLKVGQDAKVAGSNGATTLNSMVISATAPLGVATVSAKGLTSGKTAPSKTITITVATVTGGAITLSKTSVKRGTSFSIVATGFNAGERIDFKAVIGSTVVGLDGKVAGANGSVVLQTMTIKSTSPTGVATVTATGATSGKTTSKTIAVTA